MVTFGDMKVKLATALADTATCFWTTEGAESHRTLNNTTLKTWVNACLWIDKVSNQS